MGKKNSSLTRVQPVFDYINDDIGRMNKFLTLFDCSNNIKSKMKCWYGCNEKAIPPSRELLVWCINNTEKLKKEEFEKIMDSNSKTDKKRCALYLKNGEIKNEALNELKKDKLPQKAWYIFEGYTHPDIYIETENSIYVGEAKRTEYKLTDETKWLSCRDQLVRHIDAVIDETKKVYSFLIVDNEKVKDYHLSQYDDESFYVKNLPHRSQDIIKKVKESYLGYTTWSKINELFDNEIEYPETID